MGVVGGVACIRFNDCVTEGNIRSYVPERRDVFRGLCAALIGAGVYLGIHAVGGTTHQPLRDNYMKTPAEKGDIGQEGRGMASMHNYRGAR